METRIVLTAAPVMSTSDWLTVLGIIIAILSILVPYVFRQRPQRPEKKLSYCVTTTSLTKLSPEERKAQHVSAMLGDQDCKCPNRVTLRVQNTGAVHLSPEDFGSPIEVTFPGSVWLTATLTGRSNPHIDLGTQHYVPNTNTYVCEPSLLNPGDWFEIEFITDGEPADPVVSAWITDETRPMTREDDLDS